VQETDQPEVLSALVSLALLMKFLKQ
jgi:hypothetical protein